MRPYIIPIFIPHYGCPHQCVFCDQTAITGVRQPVGPKDVETVIAEHLPGVRPGRRVEIAFYGGSFTALPTEVQKGLLSPAKAILARGGAAAIRVSTRPDAIDDKKVRLLADYGVSIVELGAQSLDDKVLAAAGRGHTAADTENAVTVLKQHRFRIGLQIMPGLPEEDWLSLILTGDRFVALEPDFIRIYPTVVIDGTRLEMLYRKGQYRPLSLSSAVTRSAYLKMLADRKAIPVIRLGLQATEALAAPGAVVAGPYHPAFGEMVSAFFFNRQVAFFLESFSPVETLPLTIHHHPLDHSKLRGVAGANLRSWRQKYHAGEIRLVGDWPRQGELGISRDGIVYLTNNNMIFDC